MDLDEFMAESNARARRGRRVARQTFGAVVFVLLLTAFLFVAAPNSMGGQMGPGPGPIALVVPAIGILGLTVGLLWMVRILRADPDPDVKSWRYRGR